MIRSQDQEIQSLITDIRDGKLLLPELQRGYTWKSEQVRNLFDSLYRQYPSGQLLVWETDDLPHSRSVSVADVSPGQNKPRPQLLLDGQQRLTSLAAVMLGKSLLVKDKARAIDIVFNVLTEKFEVFGLRHQGQAEWISLSAFFTKGFTVISPELLSGPNAGIIFEHVNRLQNIKTYKYRVNVLEQLPYSEVTDIFVRINSGGTSLSGADLALAQVSSLWRGVTQEFENYSKLMKKRQYGLELDNGLLLRALVVILNGQSRFEVFFKEHRRFTEEDLKSAWQRVKSATEQAINFLVHNCYIDRLDMLPTRNILIPLVAFFDKFNTNVTSKQARTLQRWVYTALIRTRYSAATESSLDQDLAAVLNKDHNDPVQAMIDNIDGADRPVTERELQAQRKNSPYMLMSYVLAKRANAQDWFNGVGIGGAQQIEYHHIFPKALLRNRYDLKKDSLIVDQVANLAFLSARANNTISSKAPENYLVTIDKTRLNAQCVPSDSSLWKLERFEDFLIERRRMIADAINSLLFSLKDDGTAKPLGPLDGLNADIDNLESRLRKVIEVRLEEARGKDAWRQLVPSDIQQNVQVRIDQRVHSYPFEAGQYDSITAKLSQCQFSDYFKIIRTKSNWPFFQDIFGNEQKFAQFGESVTAIRNALKHGRDPNRVERQAAEAGLTWFGECLRVFELDEQGDDEDDE